MSSTHTTLDAAVTERKARLAKLKSLKRKQAPTDDQGSEQAPLEQQQENIEAIPTVTNTYLSGRNYDPTTRGPKLGFENAPSEDQETLEKRAKEIADSTKNEAEKEEKADKPIDLFKLQPKKPNWDLKRDVARKMERLNVQTENAIARLVRERIAAQKKKQIEKVDESRGQHGDEDGEREAVGMQGEELVGGVHQREREEAEEEERERKEDEEDEA